MRGACDLPQAELLAVGLAGREVAEPAEHVGLALNDHHGDTRIAADLVAAGEEATTRFIVGGVEAVECPALDRSAGAGTPLEQEPVDCGGVHIERVDIGREVKRRL